MVSSPVSTTPAMTALAMILDRMSHAVAASKMMFTANARAEIATKSTAANECLAAP